MRDLNVKDFAEDSISFKGHKLIKATHKTTFEITKSSRLTEKGDCIVGICADKACKDLREDLKKLIRIDGSKITITIRVLDFEFKAIAFGCKKLSLDDEEDIVIRKSRFVCPRTLAIGCDKAAIDIPRKIISLLKQGFDGVMIVRVER